MASKKSAKSKGYRKTVAKKPYVTKKEIIITCIIAVLVIAAFVLMGVFYDDGSLEVENGVVVTEGQNSLVAMTGAADTTKYFKYGQLAEVEGYMLTSEPAITDPNVLEYTYTPDAESAIDAATVNVYAYDAALIGSTTLASVASIEGASCSEEMLTAKAGDHNVYYFLYTQHRELADPETDPETAAEEEAAGLTEYMQALNAYIDAGEGRCITIHILNAADSEAEYVEDAVLEEALNQLLPAVSFETK